MAIWRRSSERHSKRDTLLFFYMEEWWDSKNIRIWLSIVELPKTTRRIKKESINQIWYPVCSSLNSSVSCHFIVFRYTRISSISLVMRTLLPTECPPTLSANRSFSLFWWILFNIQSRYPYPYQRLIQLLHREYGWAKHEWTEKKYCSSPCKRFFTLIFCLCAYKIYLFIWHWNHSSLGSHHPFEFTRFSTNTCDFSFIDGDSHRAVSCLIFAPPTI